jgi:hypothetical protein
MFFLTPTLTFIPTYTSTLASALRFFKLPCAFPIVPLTDFGVVGRFGMKDS